MAQHYSDPRRENDPHSLPNVETFLICEGDDDFKDADGTAYEPGWYWWSCFPGCLPDDDPVGPFASEADALADAQDGYDDGE